MKFQILHRVPDIKTARRQVGCFYISTLTMQDENLLTAGLKCLSAEALAKVGACPEA
jgi:hypothetical protein